MIFEVVMLIDILLCVYNIFIFKIDKFLEVFKIKFGFE